MLESSFPLVRSRNLGALALILALILGFALSPVFAHAEGASPPEPETIAVEEPSQALEEAPVVTERAATLPPPPVGPLLGDAGESCRDLRDCARGLYCSAQRCTHPMEGMSCGARADCGPGLRCVDQRCTAENAMDRSCHPAPSDARPLSPHAFGRSRETSGMLGGGLAGGGFVNELYGGGQLDLSFRGGLLFKGRFPLLLEIGPSFIFPSPTGKSVPILFLVGAYLGKHTTAWAPKLGLGARAGAQYGAEIAFHVTTLAFKPSKDVILELDFLDYRLSFDRSEEDWFGGGISVLTHRMLTSITVSGLFSRRRGG